MVKKRKYYCFSGLNPWTYSVPAELRTRVSKNGCGQNSDFEWDGYWTVFFIWTI